MTWSSGDAAGPAGQAEQAGETAGVLEMYADELRRLKRGLEDSAPAQWRSTAGRAFQQRLEGLAAELGACADALERAASARRAIAGSKQYEVWG